MQSTSAFRFLILTAIFAGLVLCVDVSCRASVFNDAAEETAIEEEEERVAARFDVFGDLRDCDLGARLDNFAIHLMNDKASKGHIIVYRGKYDMPPRVAAYRERIEDYLVNARGLEANRLTIVGGGYRQEMTIELWIVPTGASAPEPTETIDPTKELDKAFKFADEYISIPVEDLSSQFEDLELTPEDADGADLVKANTDEQPVAEQTDAPDADAPDEETNEATAEAQEEEAADADVWWILQTYARALDFEAKARAHIIFYADREEATFSKVQANVEQAVGQLARKYGVKAERITMSFGGYRQMPTAELWIVPVNVSLPVPTPEPEAKDKETTNQAATAQQPSAP